MYMLRNVYENLTSIVTWRAAGVAVDGGPPGQDRGEVLVHVVAVVAAAGVLRVEQREAVVPGGPGLVVGDEVARAAVGHVDAVGEQVADPRVADRRVVGVGPPVEADLVLGPDVVDRHARGAAQVEDLARPVDP